MIFISLIRNIVNSRSMSKEFCTGSNVKNTNLGKDRYIWVDLEMTGLNVAKDTILEVACIVTSVNLSFIHEGIHFVIHQPDSVLNSMSSWCKEQHAKSNLTQESRESKISLAEADELVAEYIKKHSDGEGNRYLAGNSVYMDKIFMEKYMPLSDSLLHYNILDVSSLKLLCSHWYADEYSKIPKKNSTHRAFDDILNSIKELKVYQKTIFKS